MSDTLKKYGIQANKALGQNFLQDQEILRSIAGTTEIFAQHIIEVGPGYGALTEHLLRQKPASLTLVEFDEKMVGVLEDRIKTGSLDSFGIPLEIVRQDVLKFFPLPTDYKVIANIPYYITSPILTHFLSHLPHAPSEMVILMQQEVAERICETRSSVLSLSVDQKACASLGVFVSRSCFVPAPKVDSQVLHLRTHHRYHDVDDQAFQTLIKTAFSSPRKKILSNLCVRYDKTKLLQIWKSLSLDENLRAENLTGDDYRRLLYAGIHEIRI